MTRILWIIVALALVAVGMTGPALADDGGILEEEFSFLEEEFTIESASRYVQRVSDAPASVTVITREEIGRYGYLSLGDLLQSVVGFNITNDRSYTFVGVRGFAIPSDWNSRILLLVDGHRYNEAIYGSALYERANGIDLGNVAKIEIVRGPASALYGTNAMFAVINVVTLKDDREPGIEAHVTLADPGTTRLGVRTRGRSGKLGYSLDAYLYDRTGREVLEFPEFTDPNLVDDDGDGNPDYKSGFTKNSDEADAYGFRGRLFLDSFTITGFYSIWTKEVPTAQYFTIFNADKDENQEERGYLELRYTAPARETFNWQAALSLDHYGFEGVYTYDFDYAYADSNFINPPYTLNQDDQEAQWINLEFQGEYTGFGGQRLVFGAEYSSINVVMENFDDDPAFQYVDVDENATTLSGYIQDEMSLSDSAQLFLGANYNLYDEDVYQGEVDRLNPRLAAVFGVGSGTRVKVLYGEAFRVPSLYELLYDDGGDFQVGNPDLEPEIMRSSEVILEHDISDTVTVRASAYQNLIENLIQNEDIGGIFQYNNVADDVISRGVELEIRKSAGTGLSGFANLAVQSTETDQGGEELPNSPGEMANAGVSIPLSAGVSYLSIDAHYAGKRKSADLSEEIGDFVVANATISHKAVGPNLDMSLSVRNLFDTDYAHPGSLDHVQTKIPQDGRSYSAQLNYRF